MRTKAIFTAVLVRTLTLLPLRSRILLNRALNLSIGRGIGSSTVSLESQLVMREIVKQKKNQPVIFDVGANTGTYTTACLSENPSSLVIAFEPNSAAVKVLKEKFHNHENVRIVGKACGAKRDKVTLHFDKPASVFGSIVNRSADYHGVLFDLSEEVDQITLDDYVAETGIFPDVIKLDVEGYEMEVLKGAENCLDKVSMVQFEFGSPNIDSRTFFKDFYNFFLLRNFSLFRISLKGLQPIDTYSEEHEYFYTTNFVAMRRV